LGPSRLDRALGKVIKNYGKLANLDLHGEIARQIKQTVLSGFTTQFEKRGNELLDEIKCVVPTKLDNLNDRAALKDAITQARRGQVVEL
jgi:hypothetical protein